MTQDREDYMRRQEADHALLRQRTQWPTRERTCRWCRERITTTPCQCAKAVDEHRRIMSGTTNATA